MTFRRVSFFFNPVEVTFHAECQISTEVLQIDKLVERVSAFVFSHLDQKEFERYFRNCEFSQKGLPMVF